MAGQGAVVAEFSASDTAFTGFRIVAERPWAVAIWAGLQLVVSLAFEVFVAYSAGPAFAKLQRIGLQPSQDQAAMFDLLRQAAPTYLVLFVASLVLNAVLYAAMNRAVLRPAEARFGYLRLAADELRQLGLFAIFAGIFVAAYIAFLVVAAVLVVVVGLVAGAGVALALGLAILVPAFVCAFVFLAVRLSLASPMTFETGRIDLRGAWRMTQARFWPMLGTYFIAFALSVVVIVLTLAIALPAVALAGGGMGALGPALQSDFSSIAAVLTPAHIAYLTVFAIGQALIWPVTMTPPAAIYRALAGGATTAGRVFD
jgi:hypothetical protein